MNLSSIHTNNKRLKIAYFTANDPHDKRSWSGLTYYLSRALQKNVGDVDFLGTVKLNNFIEMSLRAIAKLHRVVFGKEYITKHSILLGKYSAKFLKNRMKGKDYDVIVAPAASTELAYFNTNIPIIYISDTTFKLISRYYKNDFKKMAASSKREGNLLEKRSLQKSSLIIYPSHWAANSAMKDYNVSEDKIAILPFGANMDAVPPRDLIFEKEKNKILTLLYLAVDWERKGGQIAFETMKHLNENGQEAKLIVCGCIPPSGFSHPNMEVIPFLDKNRPDHHAKFLELLSTSHFLILPTRADCSLIVACEANAYGMPVISTETGGVPDVVKDCINGYCLPYQADASIYATLISELFSDKEKYHELVLTSRKRFEDELNWDKWSESFIRLYETKILKTKEMNPHKSPVLMASAK